MTLQKPPRREQPSRVAGRVLGLVIMASLAGAAIYTAVTEDRVRLTERIRAIDVERPDSVPVNDLEIGVTEDSRGQLGVVILHDDVITGSLTLDAVSAAIGGDYRRVRVDLPGFGLSTRVTTGGPRQTAAGMGDVVAEVVSARFSSPVVLVGVGFGGEVAAEVALSYPELVRALVMVDVDFDRPTSLETSLQTLPWLGKAATYTWETGGRFALDHWSPFCDQGGWCPTAEEIGRRAEIIAIQGTTDSIHAFRNTLSAALAPSNLADIAAPIAYVWSTEGPVPRSSVDDILEDVPTMTIVESDTFQAHLEDPEAVAEAVRSVEA